MEIVWNILLITTFEREGEEEGQRVQIWQTCCQDWRWTRSSQLAWWPTCTAAPITILWHYVSVFLQFFVFWYLWENHREDLTKLGNRTATMLTATSNVSSISHSLNLAESIMLNQFVWNRMLWLTTVYGYVVSSSGLCRRTKNNKCVSECISGWSFSQSAVKLIFYSLRGLLSFCVFHSI